MTSLLIAGSPTLPSRSTRLLHHIGEGLLQRGHRIERLNVRDLPAQALLHADFSNVDIQVARAQLAQADAVVIATPIYKASFCGVLKAFLDLLPQDGLAGKVVLPLATGGSQSHMLALDYALRPVLQALGAKQILASIYATDSQVTWSPETGLAIDPAIALRLAEGVSNLSHNLRQPSVAQRCRPTSLVA